MDGKRTVGWEREVLPLLFMAMESAWLIVVYDLLNLAAQGQARLSPGWACLLYPMAYLWGRLVRSRALNPLRQELLGLTLALPAVVVLTGFILLDRPAQALFRPPLETLGLATAAGWLMVLGWTGFAWLRGWYLAGRKVDFRGLAGGFQMGLGVFLAALPFTGLLGIGTGRTWVLLSAFFVFGLGGLYLGGRTRTGGRPAGPAEIPWLVLALLSLGAVLALGYAIWALVDKELIQLLISPILWLWERFTDLLDLLARLMPKPKPAPLPDNWATMPHLSAPPPQGPPWDFAWLRKLGEFFFVGATLLIVGMALFRSLTDLMRWLRNRFSGPGPEAVTVSDHGFLDDLKALLRGILAMLRRLFSRSGRTPDPLAGLSPEARTVREIYRRFLAWGRSKGNPRSPSQTPYEYQARMSLVLPGREDDLGLLTEAYVLVRYGGVEPGPDLLDLIRGSWKKIRSSKPIVIKEET